MLQKNDILFGYKAISLVPGLSGTDRQIAAAILDHYSRKTGRCHPSNERLSALLCVDERTVRRGTQALCSEPLMLFQKVFYAGRSGCTEYVPCWHRFHDIVSDWSRKMGGQNGPDDAGKSGRNCPDKTEKSGQFCPEMRADLPGNAGNSAPQTSIYNQSPEPIGTVGAGGNVWVDDRKQVEEPRRKSQPEGRDGLLRGQEPGAGNPPFKVASGLSHTDAAKDAALRRIDRDLMSLGWSAYSDALERMTDDDQVAATAAEIRRHGAGIHVLFERLGALGAAQSGRRPDAVH